MLELEFMYGEESTTTWSMLEFLWFAPKNKFVYKVIRPVSAIVSAKVKMRVTPFQFSRIKFQSLYIVMLSKDIPITTETNPKLFDMNTRTS